MATLTRLARLLQACRTLLTYTPYDPDDSAVVEFSTADGAYFRTSNGIYFGTGA
jgi:hypothetical protein